MAGEAGGEKSQTPSKTAYPKLSEVGIEEQVTDDDRLTMPTEETSSEFLPPRREVGVSPPSAEALEPDWEHLGG